jgi:hypothetical protein
MNYETYRRLISNIRNNLEIIAQHSILPTDIKRETWNTACKLSELEDIAYKRSERNKEGIQVWETVEKND